MRVNNNGDGIVNVVVLVELAAKSTLYAEWRSLYTRHVNNAR